MLLVAEKVEGNGGSIQHHKRTPGERELLQTLQLRHAPVQQPPVRCRAFFVLRLVPSTCSTQHGQTAAHRHCVRCAEPLDEGLIPYLIHSPLLGTLQPSPRVRRPVKPPRLRRPGWSGSRGSLGPIVDAPVPPPGCLCLGSVPKSAHGEPSAVVVKTNWSRVFFIVTPPGSWVSTASRLGINIPRLLLTGS